MKVLRITFESQRNEFLVFEMNDLGIKMSLEKSQIEKTMNFHIQHLQIQELHQNKFQKLFSIELDQIG
jgi:hypothetical protein